MYEEQIWKQPLQDAGKTSLFKSTGIEDFYKRLSRKIRIAGKSPSTLSNYTRYLAQMALHFECVPTELDTEQVEEYLEMMLDQHDTPSESYFQVRGVQPSICLQGRRAGLQAGSPAQHQAG